MTPELLNDDSIDAATISEVDINHFVIEDDEEISDEDIGTELDISHLVIEDDAPVDNFQSEVCGYGGAIAMDR